MKLSALIFDVDGTLADTEEAHRRAFNEAFAAHRLDWDWSPAAYARLLRVTGGKERIARHIDELAADDEAKVRLRALIAAVHATKTVIFTTHVRNADVPLRPGIARLMEAARSAHLKLAIASTTTLVNVQELIRANLGDHALHWFDVIVTGDIVRNKKPAPDIYDLALARLGIAACGAVAFEDSGAGLRAAHAAGLATIVVPTRWTRDQDFSVADAVLPSVPTLAQIRALHEARAATNSIRANANR